MSGRDLFDARVVQIGLIQIVVERRVQIQHAGVSELQDAVGEQRLGDGRDLENGVGRDGPSSGGVGGSVGLRPYHLTVPDERDRSARDARLAQRLRDVFAHVRCDGLYGVTVVFRGDQAVDYPIVYERVLVSVTAPPTETAPSS